MTLGAIKFTFMMVCVFGMFLTRKMAITKMDWTLLALAFLATLGADFFLLIVPNYVVGVAIFCFAHIFYAFRYGGRRIWRFFPLAFILPIGSAIFFQDALISVALAYMGLFIISYATMCVVIKNKKYSTPNSILIFLGMTLFVICDIFVAIFNLGNMGIVSHNVSEFAVDAIWLFYAPAQICLALSAMRFEGQKIMA